MTETHSSGTTGNPTYVTYNGTTAGLPGSYTFTVNPDISKPVEETDEFIHVRVRDPADFVEGSFRTTDFGGKLPKGVQAVQGKLKDSGDWATQKFIFRKADGWTSEKAQAWAKDHRDLIAELSLVGKSLLVIAPITAHKIESVGKARKLVTEGWASTGDLDRDQEIIEPSAWTKTLESYLQNPVVRFMHQDPVGKTVEARIEPAKGLYVKTKIIPTDLGRNVWKLIKAGVVKSYSIAGKVTSDEMVFHEDLDRDIHHITGVDLYEISLVDVPANPQAMIEAIAKAKSSSLVDFKDPIVIKSLIREPAPNEAKLKGEGGGKKDAPANSNVADAIQEFRDAVVNAEVVDLTVCPKCGGNVTCEGTYSDNFRCESCGQYLLNQGGKLVPVTKAEWDTAYINNLPDAAFAGILPGGEKDDQGKTVPRDLRKLPHHNASVKDPNDNDSVDKPHLRNALAQAPKMDVPADFKTKCINHLEKHAKAVLEEMVEIERLKGIIAERDKTIKELVAKLEAKPIPPPPEEKPTEPPKEIEQPKEPAKPEEPPPKNRQSEITDTPKPPKIPTIDDWASGRV